MASDGSTDNSYNAGSGGGRGGAGSSRWRDTGSDYDDGTMGEGHERFISLD
jgi:hypothetical protein